MTASDERCAAINISLHFVSFKVDRIRGKCRQMSRQQVLRGPAADDSTGYVNERIACEDGRYFVHKCFDVFDADAVGLVLHPLDDLFHLKEEINKSARHVRGCNQMGKQATQNWRQSNRCKTVGCNTLVILFGVVEKRQSSGHSISGSNQENIPAANRTNMRH